MKRFFVAALIYAGLQGAAMAESPVGEWLVEDGTARIRIVTCDNSLWGVISWTKDVGGKDDHNPDKSMRDRPVLGIPILLGMKPAGKQWDGKIYNAENGKTYDSNISLKSNNVLRVEGCILSFMCGGEDWKRASQAAKPAESDQSVCSRVTKGV